MYWTVMQYDLLSRVTQITHSDSTTSDPVLTKTAYNDSQRSVAVTNARIGDSLPISFRGESRDSFPISHRYSIIMMFGHILLYWFSARFTGFQRSSGLYFQCFNEALATQGAACSRVHSYTASHLVRLTFSKIINPTWKPF